MVQLTTIKVVLLMCAIFYLHLEQLDVKIAFLLGELEEEIICSKQKVLLKQARRTWFAG